MPPVSIFTRSLFSVVLATSLLARAESKLSAAHPAPPRPNAQLADSKLNARVEELLEKMTLEEKVGQLVQYSVGGVTGPDASSLSYDDMAAKGNVGSLLNVVGADETNHYQRLAMEKSRLKIPILFGYDVIHGDRTTFPIPLALAASFDPTVPERVARTAAIEAREDGVRWVFSPMVDIARDARWGRVIESAGEDPYLGAAVARAWVRGYQQDSLLKQDSVAVSVKHFAAYGAAIAGRDYNAVDMSENQLRQVYLKPYQAAVEAGAVNLMSSFNTLNGVPATANPWTLTQILRREWGFQGFVVSDWGAVRELLSQSVALDGAAAARKALTAGTDMDMEGGIYAANLVDEVRTSRLPESVVDEAVRRILRVKFALGLFDDPYAKPQAPYVATPQKREQARTIAEETLVLLKNDSASSHPVLLPLSAKTRSVALIGPMADDQAQMLGSWSSKGDARDVVTLRQALEEKLGKEKVHYAKGTEILTNSNAGFQEAIAAAKASDLAIVALGEDGPNMTGEAGSRAFLDLPGNQQQLLEAVAATGKPVVLVLFNGHPLALPWAAEHIPAILEAWYPGLEAGHAVASVLLGDVNPGGKLPMVFPRSVGQEPLYYAQTHTGRNAGSTDLTHPPANTGEKYLSRYVDEQNTPQWPFGWGLSYTRFTYGPVTLSVADVPLAEASNRAIHGLVTVSCDVKNVGQVAGDEVVQLYVRNEGASVAQPVRELKGFERVHLAPGEQKRMAFKLSFDELAFYNAQNVQVVEPTRYDVWVGGDSLATEGAKFTITQ